MKKIWNLLIVLAIIVSSANIFGVYAEDASTEAVEVIEEQVVIKPDVAQTTMIRLGLMADAVDLGADITRSDLAVAIYKMNNYDRKDDTVMASTQVFSDVSLYSGLSGYLEYLYNAKIVSGHGDGTFCPDDKAYATEAYSMALKSAGYNDYITAVGGYSGNISVAASRANFRTNVSFDKPLTYYDLAEILYELMFTRTVNGTTYEGGTVTYETKGLFLSEKMKLKYGDGIMTAVGKYSIDGKVAKTGNYCIDGVEYITDKSIKYFEYPGMKVRYYLNEEDMIIAACAAENQVVLTFNSDEITYGNGSYKDENEKKYILDSSYQVTYNERVASAGVLLQPKYGYVRLIDADNSGRYETVQIYDYEVIKINTIVGTKEIYAEGKNGGLSIVFDNYEDYTVKSPSGNVMAVSSLMGGAPCLLSKSMDGQSIILTSVTEKVAGKIESIRDEGIVIEGVTHKVSVNMYSDSWNGEIGVEITAYKDFMGNIVYIQKGAVLDYKYGLVIRSAEEGGIGGKTEIKLVDTQNTIKIMPLSDKARINGARVPSEGASGIIGNETFIRYKESAGEITDILLETDCDLKNSQGVAVGGDKLLRRVSGTVHYRGDYSLGLRHNGTMALAGDVLPGSTFYVFVIDANTKLADEFRYRCLSLGQILSGQNYEVDAYNTDIDQVSIDAIVIRNFSIGITQTAIAVDKIVTALNSRGDVVQKLCGYTGSGYKEYILEKESLLKIGEHELTQGDIIKPSTNTDGEINAIELMYTADGVGTMNNNATTSTNFNEWYRYIKGYMAKQHKGALVFGYEDEATYGLEAYNVGNISIAIVDMNNPNPSKRVYALNSVAEIKDFETFGNEADILIINSHESYVYSMFVVRK